MNRTILIIAILIVLILATLLISPIQSIAFLGFGARGDIATAEYQWAKTLWDWMGLLIVPALLGGIAIWFNEQTRRRQRVNEEDRFREDVLQKYFDRVTELMLSADKTTAKLHVQARNVAELRTITVLRRLNLARMQEVVSFLRDSGLLTGDDSILSGANLVEMDLAEINLTLANLQNTNFSESDLHAAELSSAVLKNADLTLTNLKDANLNGADLSGADFTGADLTGADLSYANLKGAYFNAAILVDVDLEDAVFDEHTLLPNGSPWTPQTDMKRFTDPNHPEFWSIS